MLCNVDMHDVIFEELPAQGDVVRAPRGGSEDELTYLLLLQQLDRFS